MGSARTAGLQEEDWPKRGPDRRRDLPRYSPPRRSPPRYPRPSSRVARPRLLEAEMPLIVCGPAFGIDGRTEAPLLSASWRDGGRLSRLTARRSCFPLAPSPRTSTGTRNGAQPPDYHSSPSRRAGLTLATKGYGVGRQHQSWATGQGRRPRGVVDVSRQRLFRLRIFLEPFRRPDPAAVDVTRSSTDPLTTLERLADAVERIGGVRGPHHPAQGATGSCGHEAIREPASRALARRLDETRSRGDADHEVLPGGEG